MITLYDNPFSPFARKVRLVILLKGLEFETVDGLKKSNHQQLKAYNGRVEVPALVDDGIVITNSSDIVRYLEDSYPQKSVFPGSPAQKVAARAWERLSDTFVDGVLINISYWLWAKRDDQMPQGLLSKANEDIQKVYAHMEKALTGKDYLCGDLSIGDIALFPHIASVKAMGVAYDEARFPNLTRWYRGLRKHPLFYEDLKRTAEYLATIGDSDVERRKIFWRGDRIEWILASGFEDWFYNEIKSDRVLWPGPDLPYL